MDTSFRLTEPLDRLVEIFEPAHTFLLLNRYAYRKNFALARLVGIRDVGVEDWFYSRKTTDGTPTLDDAITDYERDLAKSLRTLCDAALGAGIDAALAVETVVHFVLRAAHLRRIMSSGVTSASDEIAALVTDPGAPWSDTRPHWPVLSQAVTDEIADNAAKLAPAGLPSA